MDKLEQFINRAEGLLDQVAALLPSTQPHVIDWEALAFYWDHATYTLRPVLNFQRIQLQDLVGIEPQKQRIQQNTEQFVRGYSANNVLLSGARGTGKSSLVKALLNEYADQGLRVIQIDKQGLIAIPQVIDLVSARKERFILYCDDLSFNSEEAGYQSLKAALDGGLVALSDNLLIYATSNRRHLMPQLMQDNVQHQRIGGEVHPSESVEEKVSLSERFGLWISFYPFDQDEYLAVAAHWLKQYGWQQEMDEAVCAAALQWSLMRGSRSGRVANQFAKDWCGQLAMRG